MSVGDLVPAAKVKAQLTEFTGWRLSAVSENRVNIFLREEAQTTSMAPIAG